LLVFDMDGVLVDVGESYREAIQQTVAHFSGRRPTREEIQDWKNRGGWNDDWLLSQALLREYGCEIPFETVRDQFQRLFLGENGDGLITRERWIARQGVLERLAERFDFALFTGRPREDAQLTLDRFAGQLRFDPLIGMYEVEQPKPAPDGLLRIARQAPGRKLWYIGDTVDDARAARAAGVSFIGISAPGKPRRDELTRLLREHGAAAVLDDINQLETVL
jgi:HAD superfamily phosphatase